jgi:uncharacterized membrane protein YqhA
MSVGESFKVDLRRPRSVGEIIAGAVRCWLAYPLLFGALTLAVVVPYALIVRFVEQSNLVGGSSHGTLAALVLLLIDVLLVGPLVSALHIHALVRIGDQQVPHLREVLLRGIRVVPVVAAAQVVAGLLTAVGFVLFIVPGLFLLAVWAVVAQVAAIENTNWPGALRRSADLTRGARWHALAVVVSVGLINGVIETVGAAAVGTGLSVPALIAGVVVRTITLSFSALTSAMLYYDLHARSSGGGARP